MARRIYRGFNTALQQVDERYSWINDMIQARQQLLLQYMHLLNIKPHGTGDSFEDYNKVLSDFHHKVDAFAADKSFPLNTTQDQLSSLLSSFCELLIDYISHGHFDLYPKIIELMENATGRTTLTIAHRFLPKIEQTTEVLMRFSDRYTDEWVPSKIDSLRKDLAQVGECLEQRFINEDRLIVGLRLVHSIVATPSLPNNDSNSINAGTK